MSASSTSGLYRNSVVQGILLSQFFLQIGIWIRNFSVLLFVVEMTGEDPFAVSMVSVAEFAPIFIFSFIGGTFADRWRPKRTMIWCDVLSAVSVFAVLLALVFGSWQAVFFTTLFSAILSQFSQPSGLKLFKMHLPAQEIQAGMSLYQTIFSIFMVLGPVLGTYVFQTLGIYVAIALTGTAFLLSAAALLLLLPSDIREESIVPAPILKEMAAGIRYLLSKKALTLLGACFLAAGLALGLIQPMGVFLVTERLGQEKEFLKWLLTVYGLGMIVGGGLAAVFAKAAAPQKLLIFGLFFDAIGIAICGISTTTWLTLAGQFISGLVLPCISIGINTIMLQNTDHQFIGRVNGILSPLFTGAMVITMGMAGLLKKMFSLVAIYEAAGILFIISLLFILPLYSLPANQPSNCLSEQENA
ncbi:Predicted arabinose efflux permease, MFS family [Desulfotomaculum arcticum]|uniref:Predicted arabinose efflux permease, MFS family n=1 Tax=Desulfotruncus arcticus DSM 17038 TaxID=1121424 RepID=A0A1I2X523_9FIRM|nr:MFS transporter [Desulfotruncus arcticus]SFH08620.1 Predicted arabinose efflux permease, MFS family [Desulfotomaculum arcticum] [Desulfotruncus arcticus DSM 17038]